MQNIYVTSAIFVFFILFSLLIFRTKIRKNLDIIYVLILGAGYLTRVYTKTVVLELSPLFYFMLGWVGFVIGYQLKWAELKKIDIRYLKYAAYYECLIFPIIFIAYILIRPGHIAAGVLFSAAGGSMDFFFRSKFLKNKVAYAKNIIFSTFSAILGLLVYSIFFYKLKILIVIPVALVTGIFINVLLYFVRKKVDFIIVFTGIMLIVNAVFFYFKMPILLTAFLTGIVVSNITVRMHDRIFSFLQSGEQIIFLFMLFFAGYYMTGRINPVILLIGLVIMVYQMYASSKLGLSILGFSPLGILLIFEANIVFKMGFQQVYDTFLLLYIAAYIFRAAYRQVAK